MNVPEEAIADLIVRIESNTDSLSALALHALLERMVERITERGEEELRLNVADSVKHDYPPRSFALEEHVGRHPVISTGDVISGSVGIPPIEAARAREKTTGESDPADYPIFKDKGTVYYDDPPTGLMRFEGMFGETVLTKHREGQEGAEFSRRTYEEMFAALPLDIEILEREIRALSG